MIAILRHLAVHDFWLKIVALTLAVLIWTTVHFAGVTGPQQTRTLRDVPVYVVSGDDDARSWHITPDRVDVTVRGDKGTIEKLTAKVIHATTEVTGVGLARRVRKRVEVAIPAGLTLVRVSPTDVDAELSGQP